MGLQAHETISKYSSLQCKAKLKENLKFAKLCFFRIDLDLQTLQSQSSAKVFFRCILVLLFIFETQPAYPNLYKRALGTPGVQHGRPLYSDTQHTNRLMA